MVYDQSRYSSSRQENLGPPKGVSGRYYLKYVEQTQNQINVLSWHWEECTTD